jgi:hypothetical protein
LKIVVTHLSAGPKEKFCCATDKGVVHIFSGSSPCPVETMDLSRKAFGLTFLNGDSIAYLDKDFVLTRIDAENDVLPEFKAVGLQPKQSVFGAVYGTQSTEKVNVKKVQSLQDSRKIKLVLFQSSSHVIPTPSKLNKTFLESMLESAVVQ